MKRGTPKPKTPKGVTPVAARIYHNQWIADCPDCGNAEFVWIEEPRFMCSECFNGAIGGAWRPVEIPNDRADIEAALGARPLPKTRNWQSSPRTWG